MINLMEPPSPPEYFPFAYIYLLIGWNLHFVIQTTRPDLPNKHTYLLLVKL
ncbi:hypothetical protein HanPSC8_Chr16g0740521 [Helianthus annuus]|nr:hypothetical protein HanPSC8_Chr16g0740521 [Helianthus annuus]